MESERNTRLIALVALVAAVGGLTLGFSVYTRDLLIKPAAEVTLDTDLFKVEFSEGENAVASTKTVTASTSGEAGASGEAATINNDGANPEITGLKAKFTKPGQKVTYNFYAVNVGSIDAYLTNIDFAKTLDGANKKCTAGGSNPATDDDLVQQACNGIELTVTVDTSETATATQAVSTEHKLDKYASETYDSHPVKVEIEYKDGSTVPDGDFTVQFDTIKLTYSSTSPAAE